MAASVTGVDEQARYGGSIHHYNNYYHRRVFIFSLHFRAYLPPPLPFHRCCSILLSPSRKYQVAKDG